MNLPSLTRAALAVGACSLLALSASAKTPFLNIKPLSLTIGDVKSGAAAHLNDHLYFAGGFLSGGTATNKVVDIDLFTNTSVPLPSMPTPRGGLGLVGFLDTAPGGAHNVLLAVGGTNGGSVTGAVEMYSFTTGSWTEMTPMPTPRAYLALVPGTDGQVYAIGGINASGQTVGTVEAFNPATNTWKEVASLLTPRSHLAATLLPPQSTLIAAGGVDATGKVLNTTEVYSLPSAGPWLPGASMLTARADFGLSLAADGYLHALGGRSTTGDTKSIEGLDLHTGVWTKEPESLAAPLADFATTEGLSGTIYVICGARGSTFHSGVTRGIPPFAPTHDVVFYLHQFDEPTINGNFAMDGQVPLNGFGLLEIGLLSSTNFATFPAVSGTIGSGGSITVYVPGTLIVGAVNGLTLTATNEDGSDPIVLGSTSSVVGLSGTVTFPISTPFKIINKVLVLNVSTLVGLDLDLSGGVMYVTISGLNGKPSN